MLQPDPEGAIKFFLFSFFFIFHSHFSYGKKMAGRVYVYHLVLKFFLIPRKGRVDISFFLFFSFFFFFFLNFNFFLSQDTKHF
ncbi:hypothetical protein EV426DRAFT_607355, partial [Tirmania nivea]